MDATSDRIRVMTVHGSKGLEAPIVIMPDTAQRRVQLRDDLLEQDGQVMWRMGSDQMPAAMQEARDGRLAAEEAERDRLLYVAMTRAEKWLIVAAAGDLGKDGRSWYDQVGGAMDRLGAAEQPYAFGTGKRLSHGDWNADLAPVVAKPAQTAVTLPDWTQAEAAAPVATHKTLSPSDLGGAKALAGDAGLDEEAAKKRGRQIHLLLEHLPVTPPEDWAARSARLLSSGEDAADPADHPALLAEAAQVLTAEALKPLFDPSALAEVSITANLDVLNGQRIHGTIDRLVVTPDRVLAVDFKTNATVPATPQDCPLGLLRQMGAYAHALKQIYPDRQVQTALLWTRNATLMDLPDTLITEALVGV
jgi:ATP-dependent helicase/nuclease subunit A